MNEGVIKRKFRKVLIKNRTLTQERGKGIKYPNKTTR
jgi:hypothetical protein